MMRRLEGGDRGRSLRFTRQVFGVPPTVMNIQNGACPFKRPLFLAIPEDPKPEVTRFVEFVLSRGGEK